MKVVILILNFNGRDHLDGCLESLAAQSLAPDKIAVFDNGSNDGSINLVREKYPQVALLAHEKNLGFAEGNNRGISWIRENLNSEFIVLLNNDTKPEVDWLARLVEALGADSSLGSASSCMLYASDGGPINNAGDMPLWDGAGIARGRYQASEAFCADAEVFGACAGAAIYRSKALDEVAMDGRVFDPRYFAYNEDVDLSWRLRKRGWGCRYGAGARVVHHHAATGGRYSLWVLFHGERNRCWTLLKNFSWWLILVSPLYTLCRFVAVAAGLGKRGSGGGTAAGYRARSSIASIVWTILKAWASALLGAPCMLSKRWKYRLGWSFRRQTDVFKRFGAKLGQAAGH